MKRVAGVLSAAASKVGRAVLTALRAALVCRMFMVFSVFRLAVKEESGPARVTAIRAFCFLATQPRERTRWNGRQCRTWISG